MELIAEQNEEPRKPKNPWLRRIVVFAYVSTLSLFIAAAFLATFEKIEYNDEGHLARITVPRMIVRAGVGPAAGVMMIIGIACMRFRRAGFGYLMIGVALAGFLISSILSFVNNPAPWQVVAKRAAPDGRTYCVLYSGFLQGRTMAFARVESATVGTQTFRILASNYDELPRDWPWVVRPVGAGYADFHVSDSGLVIGHLLDYQPHFAYDTNRSCFYEGELSPFVLIGPETEMDEDYVSALRLGVDDGPKRLPPHHRAQIPSRKILSKGLTHPNPTVRELAQELLSVYRTEDKSAENVITE